MKDSNLWFVALVAVLYLITLCGALYVDTLKTSGPGRPGLLRRSDHGSDSRTAMASVQAMLREVPRVLELEVDTLWRGARDTFWGVTIVGGFGVGVAILGIRGLLVRLYRGGVASIDIFLRVWAHPAFRAARRDITATAALTLRPFVIPIACPILLWDALAVAALVDNLQDHHLFWGLLQSVESSFTGGLSLFGTTIPISWAVPLANLLLAITYRNVLLQTLRLLCSFAALCAVASGVALIVASLWWFGQLEQTLPISSAPLSVATFGIALVAWGLTVLTWLKSLRAAHESVSRR